MLKELAPKGNAESRLQIEFWTVGRRLYRWDRIRLGSEEPWGRAPANVVAGGIFSCRKGAQLFPEIGKT